MNHTAPSKPYRAWPLSGQSTQMIRKVWGLGRDKHCVDLTVIGIDTPLLMDMDAPDLIPTGSTRRDETEFANVIMFDVRPGMVRRA